jgi:hypothetical protein
MLFKKIIFYNHGHLGDTFLIKPFVREIIKLLQPEEAIFANNYTGEYITDIVDSHININSINASPHSAYQIVDDTLYFNTYFSTCHRSDEANNLCKEVDGILYNFDLFRYCFNITLSLLDKHLNLDYMLSSKVSYAIDEAPVVFELDSIPFIYDNITKILFFNQIATSGQADYKDYSEQIKEIVRNNHIVAYTSAPISNTDNERIVNLEQFIIKPDLFKIAKLAKYVNIIAGPCNAPLISTWNKNTLNNENLTYVIINSNAVDGDGNIRSVNDVGNCIFSKDVKSKTIIVNTVDKLFDGIKSLLNTKS